MFLLVGGFALVATIISLGYQLTTGKVWGPFLVTVETNPTYYWVSVAGNIVGIIFIVFWFNLVGGLTALSVATIGPQSLFQAAPSPVPLAENVCPVAKDATYGYSEANPIKIGGGAFDGSLRIRHYLDILRNANGSQVSYQPVAWPDNNRLTVYAISRIEGGELARLYVDFEHWEAIKIPLGFTCGGPLDISTP